MDKAKKKPEAIKLIVPDLIKVKNGAVINKAPTPPPKPIPSNTGKGKK